MTEYELWKFLHVLSATAWVGAGIGFNVLQRRLRKAGDMQALGAVGRQLEQLGNVYFGPLTVATLVFGLLTVWRGDLSFTALWIIIGYVGIVVTAIIGSVFIAGASKQLSELATSGPPDPALAAPLIDRIFMLTTIDLALLVVIVWAMVAKPTL